MLRSVTLLFISTIAFSFIVAGQDYVDSDYDPQKQRKQKEKMTFNERIYFGGNLGLSFGNYTSVLAEPLVGYRITPKLSAGLGIGIRYGRDNIYNFEYTNYIGRVFARYLVIPKFYVHAEYMAESFDKGFYFAGKNPLENSRTVVPFLFAGGGFRLPAGERSSIVIQILFNLLQEHPFSSQVYPSGVPLVSFGYLAGF